MTIQSWLNRLAFGISTGEASFARRGFPPAAPEKRAHLENIGRTFISGYLAALRTLDLDRLFIILREVRPELRGFAFEGAAMGLALTDSVWRRRKPKFRDFLQGPAAIHRYMLHVGYGWGVARLPWLRGDVQAVRRRFDEYLGPLIIDGYGFHEGFFHSQSAIVNGQVPRGVTGSASRLFDQGLGRCLWFYNGADVVRTGVCVGRFAATRRADLWSGVGLAATYAGGISEVELQELAEIANECRSHLAQGAAFAAKARLFAQNPTPHTDVACRILCGMSCSEAALVTDSALEIAKQRAAGDPYETWRTQIREQLAIKGAGHRLADRTAS